MSREEKPGSSAAETYAAFKGGVKGGKTDAALDIQAGATYLRHLARSDVKDPELTEHDRMPFAFAACNAGTGTLRTFRRTAASQGLGPHIQYDSGEPVASRIIGRETVDDGANRYQYDLADRMLQDRLAMRCEISP